MATQEGAPASIEEQVRAVEIPTEQLPPLPPLGLGSRLYADERVHRVVPDRAGFALTRLRTNVTWRRNAPLREDAVRSMRYLLGRSERAGDAERLAKAYAHTTARRSEFLWRPWMAQRMAFEADGPAKLREILAEGRGMILHFMHHGPYVGLPMAVKNAGVEVHAPIAPFYFEEPTVGYNGHRDRRHMLTLRAGARVFSAAGTLPLMLGILEQGGTIGLATDLPGRTEVSWLGRRVGLQSGTAKIALASKSPIVPLLMRPDARRMGVPHIGDPIDPRGYESPQALLQELVDRHAPHVLDWPDGVEWPLMRSLPADPDDAREFGFPVPG